MTSANEHLFSGSEELEDCIKYSLEVHCARARLLEVPDPKEGLLPTAGSAKVVGGKVCVCGLASNPELNGCNGVIVSFNSDGKRRYGVQLSSGQRISVRQSKLEATEDGGGIHRPPIWDFSSSALCEALRRELSGAGSPLTVVDWTATTESVTDPAHSLFVGFHGTRFTHELQSLRAAAVKDGARATIQK